MGCGSSKSAVQPAQTCELRSYRMEEVEECSAPDENMLIVIDNNVYRPFKFASMHPGGGQLLTNAAGRDVSYDFDNNPRHSEMARKMLQKYLVGMLEGKTDTKIVANGHAIMHEACADGAPIALRGIDDELHCPLLAKKQISHNTFDFTFGLPSPNHVLGLPIGQHVLLFADITNADGKCETDVVRSYTPTSPAGQKGTFNLVIKIYYKNTHPQFPEGGQLTQYVDRMNIGDRIRVAGPKGSFEYKGQGAYTADYGDSVGQCTKMGFVCGGSGITPAYQVIQSILSDDTDSTRLWLVYANQTESDIVLREELDRLVALHPTRFQCWYTLSKEAPDGWQCGRGRITQEMLREHTPGPGEDTLVTACGPPGMIEDVIRPSLLALGHADARIVVF